MIPTIGVRNPYQKQLVAPPQSQNLVLPTQITAADETSHRSKARTMTLGLGALAGVAMLAGCDVAPDPAATASQPTISSTFQKFDLDHAAMMKSPSGNHSILATQYWTQVDGQQLKEGDGKPLQISSGSSDRIVANIQDNGQYIIFGTEGVVVNGHWVTGKDGNRLMQHTGADGGPYSAAINSGGHWVAADQYELMVDGNLVVDQNKTPVDIADSSDHTQSEIMDNGDWAVYGTKGIAKGHVDVTPPAAPPAAK